MPYIIYADIELLIRKIDECANNRKKSSTMENRQTYYLWILNVNDLGI